MGRRGLRKRSPNQTRPRLRNKVLQLRRRHRWGADHIAHETGLAASTVQRILNAAGCGRLDRGDRADRHRAGAPLPTRTARRADPRRREEDRRRSPTAAAGGSTAAATTTTSAASRSATATSTPPSMTAPGSSTPRSSTTNKPSPPPGSGIGPPPGSQLHGITCERVLTDNGSCYKSGLWHRACAETGTTVKKTRPRRPQTNGKIERFHRILLEEWAYIRPWTSEPQRASRLRPASSTSTITTDPTARSAGQPQPPPSTPSGTTSPASTARRRHFAAHGQRAGSAPTIDVDVVDVLLEGPSAAETAEHRAQEQAT